MSKVFRLHTGGSETYQGWNSSTAFPYNSQNRDTIKDPDGATARHEITSIPSPFARIDLVKTAFAEVCKPGPKGAAPDLDGATIFHKMVSDALDVGEIFFNIDKYLSRIEIIPCNLQDMIDTLGQEGQDSAHRNLADALGKYLMSDSGTYNFDPAPTFYLLNYKDGPDMLNIIGATSPATLFFCTANDLSYVKDVDFDRDKPFDAEYQPLYKRDPDYVKAWFTLRKQIPDFATRLPEVDKYLECTFKRLTDRQQKEALRNIGDSTAREDFESIAVTYEQQHHTVEVLGCDILRKRRQVPVHTSQFTLRPSQGLTPADESLPLVLPVEHGNRYAKLRYTVGLWGTRYQAPYVDPEADYQCRTLPSEGSLCPYITISDLLEDYLISMPHTLNGKGFFSAMTAAQEEGSSLLLPLKPLFFRFFSVEELTGTKPGTKPLIEMSPLTGGVRVTLRVPIKGDGQVDCIEYQRLYYKGRPADAAKNEGGMREMDFTGLMMPMTRFNRPEDAHYTVALVALRSDNFTLTLLEGDKELGNVPCASRHNGEGELFKSTNYTLSGQLFSAIRVHDGGGAAGVLVPKLRPQQTTAAYEFAVDLGTSNTHIEYRCDHDRPGTSRPLDWGGEGDAPLPCLFHKPRMRGGAQLDLTSELPLIAKDFLPQQVGEGDFAFPTRTVLSCARSIDWAQRQEPFAQCNIPLTYDKRRDMTYNRVETSIKWGGNDNDQAICTAYVDCLMLMLRNKVLAGGGDLTRTRVTWFYPVSMAPNRVDQLAQTWDECYRRYFNAQGRTARQTESLAPLAYYFTRFANTTSLINIDIGGGTTDVAFAKDGKTLSVTSFRFAANALFEDDYASDPSSGIVDAYRQRMVDLLDNNGLNELAGVARSDTNSWPANMAAFLFTLKDNTQAKKLSPAQVDFLGALRRDPDFKVVFILHYAAIIYHVAHMAKALQLPMPRHISFSGNGSRCLQAITSNADSLAKLTRTVFERVLGPQKGRDLDLLGFDQAANPKEATCKGGLQGGQAGEEPQVVVLRGDGSGLVNPGARYRDIDAAWKQGLVKAVEGFFDFALDDLDRQLNLNRLFGVNPRTLDLAKRLCKKDLATYLDRGLAARATDGGKNPIEETAFFHPIKGILHTLGLEIQKQQSK